MAASQHAVSGPLSFIVFPFTVPHQKEDSPPCLLTHLCMQTFDVHPSNRAEWL